MVAACFLPLVIVVLDVCLLIMGDVADLGFAFLVVVVILFVLTLGIAYMMWCVV